MVMVTKPRKRKPICDGKICSIGAMNFIRGEGWQGFSISISQDVDDDEISYTDIKISRNEAEVIIKKLNEYLIRKDVA